MTPPDARSATHAHHLRDLAKTLRHSECTHTEIGVTLGRIEAMEAGAVALDHHDALVAALKAVTEHMDRAGGDAHGMSECPWCHADSDDQKYHSGDCELAAARTVLQSLEGKPPDGQ